MTVIRQSRLKLSVLLALFSALTVVLAFMGLVSAYLPDLWAYLGVTFFAPVGLASAVAAASAGMSLARPGMLIADETGVTFRNWRRARAYRWSEISQFIVFAPTSRLRSPGCELKEGARKFVSFGRSWEKTPEEIVEGLNEARALVSGTD